MFWRQFRATGQLRTVFHTSFTFRTIRANWKQNNSCPEWFKANFEQQYGCERCFLQVLSKIANRISRILLTTQTNLGKLKVARPLSHRPSVKRPISSNMTGAHGVLDRFYLLNKSRQSRTKRQLRRVFWRQFRGKEQFCKGFWTSFSFLTKNTNFKRNDICAQCFDANSLNLSKTPLRICPLARNWRQNTLRNCLFVRN